LTTAVKSRKGGEGRDYEAQTPTGERVGPEGALSGAIGRIGCEDRRGSDPRHRL